ncbi:N-acetylmuramoyl-L-alanine amidase family protein [Parabacteroides pacaensis]|uniref:N-acetylmuramoyl-L-alanine amidase family protein n=1 Tax=Parabacteroides pacaensis TaxID=2086575 RepID=UPI000D0E4E88|nr:N-acetylmuramoyl-L-alanine amidase [Parabacteroides pacaensis]
MDDKVILKTHVYFILIFIGLFCFSAGSKADKKFVLVIDAGHGGKDPGARGARINEKQINLAVALKLGALISSNHEDVRVVYTRKTDRFVDLDERANIANQNKADLFISIHTNAVKKGSSVRGTETYTLGLARTDENLEVAMRENSAILLEDNYLQKYEGFDPNSSESYIIFEFMQNKHMEQSISLASEIQKAFRSAGRINRGVYQAGFLVLRKTSMPSVLIELGFISNQTEENFLRTTDGQNKLAQSIYKAFTKYKSDYDRRQGALKSPHTVSSASREIEKKEVKREGPVQTVTQTKITENSRKQSQNTGKVVYKVQILTSDKKLPAASKRFKGHKNVDYYTENGIYKYTYGESTSFNTIKKVRRELLKDFKDAFIIAFKDGEKVKY